jgi:sporulation protein YabP
MEITNDTKPQVHKDHKVIMDNRRKITITSVTKAISANASSVLLQLQGSKCVVNGKELHINKLDINDGIAEIVGEIYSFKYSGTGESKNFFKRMFQ